MIALGVSALRIADKGAAGALHRDLAGKMKGPPTKEAQATSQPVPEEDKGKAGGIDQTPVKIFAVTQLNDTENFWWKDNRAIIASVPVKANPQNSHALGTSKRFYEVVVELGEEIDPRRSETLDRWSIKGADQVGVGISGATDDLSGRGRRFRMTTFVIPPREDDRRYSLRDC